MLVELRQSINLVLLDRMEMIDPPMPGQWFLHDQASYLVMERRHRYKLSQGRDELSAIALQKKARRQPADAHTDGQGWTHGDAASGTNGLRAQVGWSGVREGSGETCGHREAR